MIAQRHRALQISLVTVAGLLTALVWTEIPWRYRADLGGPVLNPVGEIFRVEKGGRVRDHRSLRFDSVRENREVENRSWILTREGEHVEIALDGGRSGVRVGPLSLVQIERGRVRVRRGRVALRGLGSMELEQADGSIQTVALSAEFIEPVLVTSPPPPSPLPSLKPSPKPSPTKTRPRASPPPPPPPKLQKGRVRKLPDRSWLDSARKLAQLLSPITVAHAADEHAAGEESFEVVLQWDEVQGISRFRLQVSDREDFSSPPFLDRTVNGRRHAWRYVISQIERDRDLYFRVASVTADGRQGEFSEPMIVPISKEVLARIPYQKWSYTAGLPFGIANLSQSNSNSDFLSVTTPGVFLANRLTAHAEWAKFDGHVLRRWLGAIDLNVGTLAKGPTSRAETQPTLTTYRLRLEALRSIEFAGSSGGAWDLWIGAIGVRGFRMEKIAEQTLAERTSLSLGPSFWAVRHWKEGSSKFRPARTGLRISVPVLGLAWGGHVGIEAQAWSEWNIAKWRQFDLGARLELDAALDRWIAPYSASLARWSLTLAPLFSRF